MKCACNNRRLIKEKEYHEGNEEALRRLSVILNSVLSDKNGYSNKRISQILASINSVISELNAGKLTQKEMLKILEEEHNASIIYKESRIPEGTNKNYSKGILDTADKVSLILAYVMIHKYRFGEEKMNKLITDINSLAVCINRKYVTSSDIVKTLREEQGLEVQKFKVIK